ncbi:MAG: Type 1 glutamine amidotransferase-like domain-containing protein, partial [Actinomycetota bacterium]
GCRELDAELLAAAGASEVVVIPAAAAYEHPERVGERAAAYFGGLGASVRTLPVLHRRDAEDPALAEVVRKARFVHLADGSPLHLRSVLKGSALFEAVLAAFHGGAVLAASGAGATLVGDPMVDPRGGAYTVGLAVAPDLAVFPYHGTAADHMRERSIELLPPTAKLVGIDEDTALVRDRSGAWRVAGSGAVTVYEGRTQQRYAAGDAVPSLA